MEAIAWLATWWEVGAALGTKQAARPILLNPHPKMSFLKNPWVALTVGLIVGGTLLSNKIGSLPVLNKIPKL